MGLFQHLIDHCSCIVHKSYKQRKKISFISRHVRTVFALCISLLFTQPAKMNEKIKMKINVQMRVFGFPQTENRPIYAPNWMKAAAYYAFNIFHTNDFIFNFSFVFRIAFYLLFIYWTIFIFHIIFPRFSICFAHFAQFIIHLKSAVMSSHFEQRQLHFN